MKENPFPDPPEGGNLLMKRRIPPLVWWIASFVMVGLAIIWLPGQCVPSSLDSTSGPGDDPEEELVEVDQDKELEFREDALFAIAKKAMQRKTGARGLRSIVEAVLLETMYELPSMDNVSKVVIDETVIRGESKPILIYDNADKKAASE